jgi:multidrug efflux system membrane fusion protein
MSSRLFLPCRPIVCALLLTAWLAVGGAGCGERDSAEAAGGGGKSGKGGRGGGGGAAPVVVARVERKEVPLTIDAIGAVEPIRMSTVRSQVTGILLKRVIAEGQDVKEGDLLFEIDARPFRNALLAAEADLEKAKVQRQNARAQVERYKTLSADQMVSKEQFQKISDDARALDSTVLAAEAAVANARLQLDNCSIRAPLTGRTGNMGVHEGDLVRASDSGTPLVTINQLNPINVTFGVPQQYLGAVMRYRSSGALKVTAVPPGTDEKPEDGELTFVDNTVDSATGTLKLKGTFANPKHRLWPGQFVTVTVTLAAPEVVTIPNSAIQTSQSGQHVYVVLADHTAELRPVVVERLHENDAVIAKGLSVGETVVVDGQLRVIPGKPVEIKDPANPGAPTGASAAKGGRGPGKKGGKKQT